MTKPHSGKPRQLLRADRRSNQDRRQLKFFDQQTIEEPISNHPKNPQTQLKQSQLETQKQGPLAHQQVQSIILCMNYISEEAQISLKLRRILIKIETNTEGQAPSILMSRRRASIDASRPIANIGAS